MTLEPLDPDTALRLYLANQENKVTDATLYSHNSRLGHFVRWCDQEGITNLNEFTGRRLHAYRLWRRKDGKLQPASKKTQMDTVRVFVKWLEPVDAVEPDLYTKVRSPTLTGDDNVRDVVLTSDNADRILDYLQKYEYTSRPHVALSLLWHTMMRVGAVHALDCDDYDPSDQSLQLVHRPETGSPLKNGEDGKRFVALSEELGELLDDWLADRRPAVTEESGREPLVTTRRGAPTRRRSGVTATVTPGPVLPPGSVPTIALSRAVQRLSTTRHLRVHQV